MNSQMCCSGSDIPQLLNTKMTTRLDPETELTAESCYEMKIRVSRYRQIQSTDGTYRFIQHIMKPFLILGLLIFALPVQAQDEVGYVLSIEGDWHLKGVKQSIKRWQKLSSGATIKARNPIKKSSYITVALFNGETISRTCNQIRKCNTPITLQKISRPGPSPAPSNTVSPSKAQSSWKERVSKAFWSLFEHPETYFVPTLARAEAVTNLQEAVVEWNSGQVNLTPVFKKMAIGSYSLVAEQPAIKDQQSSPENSIPIVIDWDPGHSASATTDKLKPGLYRLIGQSNYEAWVLVTPSEKYQTANDAFQKAVEITKQWGGAVDPATAQMFLRAYLGSLAKAD
jgi:hypothetical protein